jgi:hypothetical protein
MSDGLQYRTEMWNLFQINSAAENERVRGSFSAFAQFAAGASRPRGSDSGETNRETLPGGVFRQPNGRIQFRFLVPDFLRAYDSVANSRSRVMNCCGSGRS